MMSFAHNNEDSLLQSANLTIFPSVARTSFRHVREVPQTIEVQLIIQAPGAHPIFFLDLVDS